MPYYFKLIFILSSFRFLLLQITELTTTTTNSYVSSFCEKVLAFKSPATCCRRLAVCLCFHHHHHHPLLLLLFLFSFSSYSLLFDAASPIQSSSLLLSARCRTPFRLFSFFSSSGALHSSFLLFHSFSPNR